MISKPKIKPWPGWNLSHKMPKDTPGNKAVVIKVVGDFRQPKMWSLKEFLQVWFFGVGVMVGKVFDSSGVACIKQGKGEWNAPIYTARLRDIEFLMTP